MSLLKGSFLIETKVKSVVASPVSPFTTSPSVHKTCSHSPPVALLVPGWGLFSRPDYLYQIRRRLIFSSFLNQPEI